MPPTPAGLPSVLYKSSDIDRYLNGALGDTTSTASVVGIPKTVISHDSRSVSHMSPITANRTLVDFNGRIAPRESSPQRDLLATADIAAYTSRTHFPSYLDLKTQGMVERVVPHTKPISAQLPGASLRQKSSVRGLNTDEFHHSLLSKDRQLESLTDTVLALSNENTSLKSEAMYAQDRISQLVADRELSQTTMQGLQMQLEAQSKQFTDQVTGWELLQKETTDAHRLELENVRTGLTDAVTKIQELTINFDKSRQETLIAQNESDVKTHQISNLETLSQVQQQRLLEMSQSLAGVSESRDIYNSQVQYSSDTRDEVIVVEEAAPEMIPMNVIKPPVVSSMIPSSRSGSDYRQLSPQRGASSVNYQQPTPTHLPHKPEDIRSMKESVASLRHKVAQLEAQRFAIQSQRSHGSRSSRQSYPSRNNQHYPLNTEYI